MKKERKKKSDGPGAQSLPGSQTLWRALNIIEAVADGSSKLAELSAAVSLTRSTTHRLAAALVDRRYLGLSPGVGYSLGPKLLELGHQAKEQSDLPRVARSHLEGLAKRSGDAVHLAVRDGQCALYIDRVAGSRRVEIRSRIGERMPLRSTGLGKALLLDGDEAEWRAAYTADEAKSSAAQVVIADIEPWLARMRDYARQGYALDVEESDDRVRCVAAPVRNAAGNIVASISVAAAAQYMSDDRMKILSRDVRDTAAAISRDLGVKLQIAKAGR